MIDYINIDYFNSKEDIKIRIEMDEMWSFYHDKSNQIWLWWAIDHDTGDVAAYWFGTREHKNLDKLIELLTPLEIGAVYTDGNYAYFKRFSDDVLVVSKRNTQKIERKWGNMKTKIISMHGIIHDYMGSFIDKEICKRHKRVG